MGGQEIGALFVRIGADVNGLKSGLAQGEKDVKSFTGKINGVIGTMAKFGVALAAIGVVAVVGGLVYAAKAAGDFQSKMTGLVTGAGESKDAIGLVSKGILDMAGQVGQSAGSLADGMFMIESAGYRGAAGLNVLKNAAEGAKVGNAQLATVADAVTTVLADYHMGAEGAADATNFLVAVVKQGKTHMEDLAGSLAHVLPFASALHVPLDQIGGAMATMTAKGIPAADAATYLRFTMSALANETPKGAKALQEIGLTSKKVGQVLQNEGLLPALKLIQDHLAKKFPKGGTDMVAALGNIVGGTRGLGAALQLTGMNLNDFISATANVSKAIKEGKGHVIGWADVQKDLNFQVDAGKAAFEAAGIKLGTKLLPGLTQLMGAVVPMIPKLADMGSAFLDKVVPPAEQFAHWLGSLRPDFQKAFDIFSTLKPYLVDVGAAWIIWNVALAVTKALSVASMIMGIVGSLITMISTQGLATSAWYMLNLAMDANPIGLVIIAVALVAAGLIYAYQHSETFRNFVNALWDDLKRFASWLADNLGPILSTIGDALGAVGSFLSGSGGHSTGKSFNPRGGGTRAFASGGIVPGAIGAPYIIRAHGGERVLTPAQQRSGGGYGDTSQVTALLGAILNALQTPPGGQTGVEAALYKAVSLSGMNRGRGMAGA